MCGCGHAGIRSLGLKAGDPHNGGKDTIRVTWRMVSGCITSRIASEKRHCIRHFLQSDQQVTGIVLLHAPYLDCGAYGWEAEVVSRGCDIV